ncbi:MAG: hypothetical protein AAB459_02770, partial [Patescibacteria group bacterium]
NPMPGSNNPQAIGSPNLVPQNSGVQVPVSGNPGAQLPVASGNLQVTTACEPSCSAQTSIPQPNLTKASNSFVGAPVILACLAMIFVLWITRSLQPAAK